MADEPVKEPESAAMQEAINDALSRVVQEVEGGFAMKWVVILETAAPDGTVGAWTLAAKGVKGYEVLGMLEYARQTEQARRLFNLQVGDEG